MASCLDRQALTIYKGSSYFSGEKNQSEFTDTHTHRHTHTHIELYACDHNILLTCTDWCKCQLINTDTKIDQLLSDRTKHSTHLFNFKQSNPIQAINFMLFKVKKQTNKQKKNPTHKHHFVYSMITAITSNMSLSDLPLQ